MKIRTIIFSIASIVFLALGQEAWGQATMTFSGVIVDEDNLPMPGVAVYDPTNLGTGTMSSEDGRYTIIVPKTCKEIVFEFMGYEKKVLRPKDAALVVLKIDAQTIEEVVVTGIFTRKADSFTGAVQSISADNLKKVGNKNVLESLKNIDPSLMMLENLEAGSNPNAMSSMQIRGASSLDIETTSMKSNFVSKANTPLFILDGFETSLEKIKDMDMNRVESITILKDASAKAIYGSKGGNGVIVIETKSLDSGKTAVTYTGNVSVEMPDLTSYNLCNALEKLQVEQREGYYNSTSSTTHLLYQSIYNERLKKALEGESTYWLSKPLRVGVGNKHSVSVELGNRELKSFTSFSYNDNEGAMKGSFRRVITGDMNLAYRHKKWVFRNIMSISDMNSSESPYGSFYQYAKMNPYYNPYDADGNLVRVFPKYSSMDTYIVNPLYDAMLNVVNTSAYLDFSDNFYVEFSPVKALKLVARFGVNKKKTTSELFYPSTHSKFYSTLYSSEDDMLKKGEYEISYGDYLSYSGDVSAQFNKTIADDHDIFATAQYNISETTYGEVSYTASGFPSSRMDNIIFARQYKDNSTPVGTAGLNRNLGALLTTGYSYKSRYMLDATIKASASSVFGTNNRWGTFWSFGVAWNLHNEEWLSADWLKQFKIRYSMGSSGNQNYATNNALAVYSYYNDRYYNGFSGVRLDNMENPNLGWETKMDYNLGLDFRTRKLNIVLDAYVADTHNMVFSRSILPSTGFSTASDNLGVVRNKGIELSVNYTVYQSKRSFFTLMSKIATNDNRILQISESMEAYNKQQQKAAEEAKTDQPVIQYYDGMPIHSIWVVPSLGIDPVTGNEVFIAKDGTAVASWKASNLVNFGSSDPLVNGNFGFSSELRGIGTSVVFTYYGGGYRYNSTLVGMVENTNLENNVDRRIFSGRWYQKGVAAQYRNGSINETQPTSRFVQANNVMSLSSVSVYYEFPTSLIKKAKLSRLRASIYGSDLYTWSSIHIERGTSYPYARTVSFSLTATF